MTRIFIFFTLFFGLITFKSIAGDLSTKDDRWYSDIKTELYNCNLKNAKSALDKALLTDKNNPYLHQLMNHHDLLQVIFFENDKQKTIWLNSIETRIEYISEAKIKDVDKFFILAESQLHATAIYMQSNNELKGIKSFRKGFNAYKNLEEIAPKDARTAKIRGIYNIFLGSIPEKHDWVVSLLGMEGDFNLGISSLKFAFENANSPGDIYEIGFYYALFSAFFSENPEIEYKYFKKLDANLYKNPILRHGLSILAEASKSTNDCLPILLENDKYQGDTKFNLLNYQIGVFLLYQLNPLAETYLTLYQQGKSANSENLNAERSLYWHYIITNQMEKAEQKRQTIRSQSKKAENEQAAYIIHEITTDNPPNIYLLKARLLYMGGDFQNALRQINHYNQKSKNPRQNLEFYYRSASIHEALNNIKTAKIYYKNAIALGKDKNWYFAPQSALNLGNIYAKENNNTKAKQYYKMCIDINKSPYKESINRKAKYQLKQMN